MGPPAPKPDHEPGPLAFGDPDYIRRVLTGAGFDEIAVERAHPTIIGGSPEEEARPDLEHDRHSADLCRHRIQKSPPVPTGPLEMHKQLDDTLSQRLPQLSFVPIFSSWSSETLPAGLRVIMVSRSSDTR